MKLHPSLVAVLTGLDADEQDIVERLCDADWDRVSIDDSDRVCVDDRPTVFTLLPLIDPELEQYFLDSDADSYALAEAQEALQAGVVSEQEMLERLDVEGHLDVEEPEHPICPCGCGEKVISKSHGRQRIYATDRCRRKVDLIRKRERKAAKAATTPVVEPVVELVDQAWWTGTGVVEPVQPAEPVQRRVWCARCEQDGHYVEDCPQPLTRRKRVDKVDKVHHVPAPVPADVSDDMLAAHSNTLRELCKDGLPTNLGYDYKDEVLSLYGIDLALMDAALRNPERVEIRPESRDKDKRYCILSFHRGDLVVILGMRLPASPRVIAVYASSRLEHDTHQVNHSGGGAGGAKATGLPKTSRQVVTRLRAMGGRELKCEIDPRQSSAEVTYKGQSLGKIASDGDRATCMADYQRIQRKMAAIDRRVSA